MALTGAGRKLGAKRGRRVGLLRNLTTSLFLHEKITTTVAKAKEASRYANHLIAVAKKGDLNAQKRVAQDIHNVEVRKKLFDVLAPRYATRVGGCTQIFRLANRQGDNAEMALLRLVA
jgi:large subunit ribosomal protein L17